MKLTEEQIWDIEEAVALAYELAREFEPVLKDLMSVGFSKDDALAFIIWMKDHGVLSGLPKSSDSGKRSA